MPSSLFVRTRNGGKSFELRLIHPNLGKPVYRTFDLKEDAERAGRRALEDLRHNVIPAWLRAPEPRALTTVAQAIHAYHADSAPAASTEGLLDTLVADIGTTPLTGIDYAWAEEWVLQMKLQHQLAPGTIRKKKGALSSVFDWLVVRHPRSLASNPLDQLPHGYSAYNRKVRARLAETGIDASFDIERNRRIDPDEELRIVKLLQERVQRAETSGERDHAEGLCLMFQLALRTAMRMREIYTLTMDQVRLPERTIFLTRTKNGDRRQVPLGSEARAVLEAPWPALDAVRQGGRLLPFWNGSLEVEVLEQTTSRLSKAFGRLFDQAGSEDLHFHDTRHEAICRWVLNAPMPLTSEELGRAAGMRDARTRQRYLSLRGSELAEKLG